MSKTQAGFSLIELLIVVSIFGIITAGFVPYAMRLSTERNLNIAAQKLISSLQLQQTNAMQGVAGTWHGAIFSKDDPAKILLYQVNNPATCLINRATFTNQDTSCQSEGRPFPDVQDFEMKLEITTNTPLLPTLTAVDKIDVRFNRGPYGNEAYVLSSVNSPQVERARITLAHGSNSKIIVIEGGNICNQASYMLSPAPCQTIIENGSPVFGGGKFGRIYLVD